MYYIFYNTITVGNCTNSTWPSYTEYCCLALVFIYTTEISPIVLNESLLTSIIDQLLDDEFTPEQLAQKLNVSEKTIRNRLSLIFRQLHLKNRTQAALYAVREGLADSDPSNQE